MFSVEFKFMMIAKIYLPNNSITKTINQYCVWWGRSVQPQIIFFLYNLFNQFVIEISNMLVVSFIDIILCGGDIQSTNTLFLFWWKGINNYIGTFRTYTMWDKDNFFPFEDLQSDVS